MKPRSAPFLLTAIAGLLLPVLFCGARGRAADQPSGAPIRYATEQRTEPRPLQIHRLTFDMRNPDYELGVAIGEDPDGGGPVEALLTAPARLASRARFVAAVNTNPWVMMPSPGTGRKLGYVVGGSANISGWAKRHDRTASPPQPGHWSFWVDAKGRAQIATIREPVSARCAVAGFSGLIHAGELLPQTNRAVHPRTALGLDRDRRWLTMLVVDGRQPGYSEGVSLRELADIMQQQGCWEAVNLDGGGSTIMLLADEHGNLAIKNRPSGTAPRPIPVMLGVRRRQ